MTFSRRYHNVFCMTTKFETCAARIRAMIDAGRLRVGDQLPTEPVLCEEHQVSRMTLRRAMDVLEAEGRIVRRHGAGTFVADLPRRLVRDAARYQWEKNRVLLPEADRAARGSTEVDTGTERHQLRWNAWFEEVSADDELAAAFDVEEGEPMVRRTYLSREVGSPPFGRTISHLRIADVRTNPALLDAEREPWPGGTQHQLWTVGIEVTRIDDQIKARTATAAEAQTLEIRDNAPVIALRKVSWSAGRVVEVADNVWPASHIELRFTTHLEPLKRTD